MITIFSILGLGAIGNRIFDVARNHNGKFPHGWREELMELFTTFTINTGCFVFFMIVIRLLF